MTLSPTALEAAAKAVSVSTGDEPDKLTYAREMQCSGADREPQYRWQYWTEHATAAITAYLAQAGKEGWVMVPLNPTPAMIDAGTRETEPSPQDDPWYGAIDLSDNQAEQCYRSMLAAAQNGGEPCK